MSDKVRIGVVGTGSIALRGILPHLTQDDLTDRLQVTAVCDPVEGRAAAAAEKFGVPHSYVEYEELLDSGHVDAVSIASPIGFHYEQGMQAGARGVHLHFNKTMTTTVAEADELIEAAEAKGVKIAASPGEMLRPINRRIRELIKEGAVGIPTWAHTGSAFGTYHEDERVRQGGDVLTNINPTWYYKRPGGGPLFDMTVYGLHRLTGILGPAKRVTAMSGVRVVEREFRGEKIETDMDDNTLITLDFGDALFAFVYGVAAGGIGPVSVYGTSGRIVGDKLNGDEIDYPGREEIENTPGQSELPHVVGPHREIEEAHVYEDVMQLVDWIREDKPTVSNAHHARHVVEIFDAAYRSSESGQAQDLTSTFPTVD